MKHPDYPGASSMTDRHGKQRWRLRRAGHKDIMLPGEPHGAAFDAAYNAAVEGIVIDRPRRLAPNTNPQGVRGNFPRRIERMLRQIRLRSVGLSREFDLTEQWLIAELERCDYRCSLTGIPFQADRIDGKRANPFAPSIDRVDNSRGYTPDNVRLVLTSVNLALSDFGIEHFDQICRARVMKILEAIQ